MPIENIPPVPKPIIDADGLTLPLFVDMQTWLETVFKEIYGYDIYITSDSQDGQIIGILSDAFHDYNSVVDATYNAFSPSTAQGVGLSRVVKINGLRRKIPTRSSVDVRLIGWAGTTISNGIVSDLAGQRWSLPSTVVIPPEAELIVTALARDEGEVFTPAHTVTRIDTTTRGWQSVDNPEASTLGMPIEDDSMLRVRQSISTALPAKSAFESLVGAVAAIEGTNRYRGFENESTGPDSRGIPQNSVSIVVEGGDAEEIARTIYLKKAPGTITWGTEYATVIDEAGIPHKIYFSRPRQLPVIIGIPITPLARYTASKDLAIRTAVSNWVNSLRIGHHLFVEEIATAARLISPTYPDGDPTFKIRPPVMAARNNGDDLEEKDIIIAFDERVTCTTLDVLIQIVPQEAESIPLPR